MTNEELVSDLQAVFSEVFGEVPTLTIETTADDIEAWDSLSHFELIFAIEQKFDLKVDSRATRELGTVEKICELLQSKVNSNLA